MQTILEKRRTKVERLTKQALTDAMPNKYIQGRFLLQEIDRRQMANEANRIDFLTKLKA